MSSVAFVTLGCKVNQFETEVMEGLFKEAGYEILPHEAKADIYVINTCSVTSLGDKKSRQLIRRVQRQNPEAIIAVTGCYAQIAPEQIKAIEGVRVVLGTANRSRIVEYVEQAIAGNGRIIDLVLPLLVLIGACVYGMLYTGGIHDGVGIQEAFANCDSSKSLVFGSFIAFVFTAFLYLPRGVISFSSFCETFVQGFKAMTPANLILCFAWTLSGICSDKYLNLGGYVGQLVSANASVLVFLPAIFFIVAIILAFATGTSWGTFGILIPIAIAVIGTGDQNLLVITVAAILSGAVGGDHASPISDTTILASAGAQCSHIDHVSSQIPYVAIVASASFVGFVVDGVTNNGWLGLATAVVIMAGIMALIYVKVRPVDIEH